MPAAVLPSGWTFQKVYCPVARTRVPCGSSSCVLAACSHLVGPCSLSSSFTAAQLQIHQEHVVIKGTSCQQQTPGASLSTPCPQGQVAGSNALSSYGQGHLFLLLLVTLSSLRLQLERLGEDARRHDREVRKLEDSIGRLSNCVDRARTKVRWAACIGPTAPCREASWAPSATPKLTCIGHAPRPQAAFTERCAACASKQGSDQARRGSSLS